MKLNLAFICVQSELNVSFWFIALFFHFQSCLCTLTHNLYECNKVGHDCVRLLLLMPATLCVWPVFDALETCHKKAITHIEYLIISLFSHFFHIFSSFFFYNVLMSIDLVLSLHINWLFIFSISNRIKCKYGNNFLSLNFIYLYFCCCIYSFKFEILFIFLSILIPLSLNKNVIFFLSYFSSFFFLLKWSSIVRITKVHNDKTKTSRKFFKEIQLSNKFSSNFAKGYNLPN